jgi:hypothetical protein
VPTHTWKVRGCLRNATSACSVMSIVLLSGCMSTSSATQSDAKPRPTTSSALPSPPSPTSPKVRVLSCKEQLTPTTPATKSLPHVLGLASDGWVGSPKVKFEHSITTTNGRYDGFKTYTYVTRSAAERTSIHMEDPQDGLLFYTSGGNWNSELTDMQIVAGATRSVTLSGCRHQPAGYAGEFVLKAPACVRLLVVAHRPGADIRRRLVVPMGKHC